MAPFAVQRDLDQTAAGLPGDGRGLELGLHVAHAALHGRNLFHDVSEILHRCLPQWWPLAARRAPSRSSPPGNVLSMACTADRAPRVRRSLARLLLAGEVPFATVPGDKHHEAVAGPGLKLAPHFTERPGGAPCSSASSNLPVGNPDRAHETLQFGLELDVALLIRQRQDLGKAGQRRRCSGERRQAPAGPVRLSPPAASGPRKPLSVVSVGKLGPRHGPRCGCGRCAALGLMRFAPASPAHHPAAGRRHGKPDQHHFSRLLRPARCATSEMPLSSICQARVRCGMPSLAANSIPVFFSISVRLASSAAFAAPPCCGSPNA